MKIEFYLESTLLDLLKRHPIDSIRVTDIIVETGICKGTFYKYYQDKYDLLLRTFERSFYDEIRKDCTDTEQFLKNCLRVFHREPLSVVNAFCSQDLNSIRSYQENLMRTFVNEDMRKIGMKPSDKRYSFARDLYIRNVSDIIIDWLRRDCQESEIEVCRTIRNIVPYIICDLSRMKLSEFQ